MNPRASAAKYPRGGGLHPWVPLVDGMQIQGMQFETRKQAIEYAERVAEWWPAGTFDRPRRQGMRQRWFRSNRP